MHDDTIELRQPTDDAATLRAYSNPVATAFADDYTDALFAVDRQLWEMDRLIGAVEGETWVGSAAAGSLRLIVPGGAEVHAAGITGVGVLPTHRRRGILTRMMRWLIDQAVERGEPVAILRATDGAIYPHFGFGLATLQGAFEVERNFFRFSRPAEPLGRVRLVDVDEGMRVTPAIFDAVRVGRPGEISRSPVWWRLLLLADDSRRRASQGLKYNAVLEVDGVPRGYAIYRVKNDWDDRGPRHVLTVLEVTGLDVGADRAIWEWLAGIDLIVRIKAIRTPVLHPLFLQLEDMQRLGLSVNDGVWLRLVDLRAALEARSYVGSGRVTLEVTDAFCPSNAGRWTLDVAGDRGAVSAAVSGVEADLALDTTDLATIYLGAFTFADLARADRVRECRPGAVAAADRLFTTAEKPWCSTGF